MSAVETNTVPRQPDIQYHPDYEKYKERTRQRKETETLQTTLPAGFPQKLVSPLVWEGSEVVKGENWIYHLKDAELEEVDAALKSFKGIYGCDHNGVFQHLT